MTATTTVDTGEIDQFEQLADEWWAPGGAFEPLHRYNPVRLAYIRDQVCRLAGIDDRSVRPFEGLSILDIGCGGGLLAEPLARLGGSVTGIDASDRAIDAARTHAAQSGLTIDYRKSTAETLADQGFVADIVTAMEVVEHVADIDFFVATCARLLKPEGVLVMSTINRTRKAWLLAIVGAEYVLRWVPRGTHDWQKFVKPHELAGQWRNHGIAPVDSTGVVFDPITRTLRRDPRDLAVNYMMAGIRR